MPENNFKTNNSYIFDINPFQCNIQAVLYIIYTLPPRGVIYFMTT